METRRRYGPAPLATDDKRGHCISTRVTLTELARIDELRAPLHMQRGEYLRACTFGTLPPAPAPELNRSAWRELARAAANLNQLAHHANGAGIETLDIDAIARELAQFRLALLRAQ